MDFHARAADDTEHLRFKSLLYAAKPGELAMGGNPVAPFRESHVDVARGFLISSQFQQEPLGGRQGVSMRDCGQSSAILRISHDPSSRQLDCG